MRKNVYIGISFIVLIFGIWAVPKIVAYFQSPKLAILKKAPDFEFINQHGKRISNKDYQGKVYVVEFFFTNCPSICPRMNFNMAAISNKFFGNPKFGIAAFTIDPEHDTPEVLKAYAVEKGYQSPNWHFLTGDKERIYQLANTGFNMYAGQNDNAPGGFEHSGMFVLIDQDGMIRSRYDKQGNPIVYYDGIEQEGVQDLKEDIGLLVNQ